MNGALLTVRMIASLFELSFMPKPLKKKRVQRTKLKEIELHPDAWERFEEGLKRIVKPQPKHLMAATPSIFSESDSSRLTDLSTKIETPMLNGKPSAKQKRPTKFEHRKARRRPGRDRRK